MAVNNITKTFGVYQIRNLLNDKVYVGSTTTSFSRRWRQWKQNLKRGKANRHLQAAWDKDGENNFVFEILESTTDKTKALAREQFWMDTKQSYSSSNGYNFDRIARSRLNKPSANPEDTRRKMSEAHKGHAVSEETREKCRLARLGKKHSEEAKAKISKLKKGVTLSQETKDKLAKASANRQPLSEESRNRISMKHKGRVFSEETKRKMSEAAKKRVRKPHTEESKKKMRENRRKNGKESRITYRN